jgi:hypothetical protein
MKNYILTFLLAVLVVLASVSLRRAITANGVSATNAGAVLAIGPSPMPIPPSKVAIGPSPMPIPPSKVAIGPSPMPIPPSK